MDKLKRVLAMAGVILLVFMYLMTIITAATATDEAHNWFIGSIMMTVFVPVILYAINMLINIQKRNEDNNRMREEMYMRQIKDSLKAKAEQEKAQQEAQTVQPESQQVTPPQTAQAMQAAQAVSQQTMQTAQNMQNAQTMQAAQMEIQQPVSQERQS